MWLECDHLLPPCSCQWRLHFHLLLAPCQSLFKGPFSAHFEACSSSCIDNHRWRQSREPFCNCSAGSPSHPRCSCLQHSLTSSLTQSICLALGFAVGSSRAGSCSSVCQPRGCSVSTVRADHCWCCRGSYPRI